jgi:chromosome partitioning protein
MQMLPWPDIGWEGAVRTIAVVNRKGGSGKTTTAVSVAAALAERGQSTLLIDLDPQASASAWLAEPSDHHGPFEAFIGTRDLESSVEKTGVPGLQVVPASPWLVEAERTLKGQLGVGVMHALERLGQNWAFVIIDCPPALSYLSIGALMAAREVIIPVEAHSIALPGVAAIVGEMRRLQSTLNPALWDPLIVACRVNRTIHARRVIEELDRVHGELLARTTIRESIRFAEAAEARMPITSYAPESGACLDYRLLAEELVEREYLHAEQPRRVPRWRHIFGRSGHADPLERRAM